MSNKCLTKTLNFNPAEILNWNHFKPCRKITEKTPAYLKLCFRDFAQDLLKKTTMERLEMNGTSDGNTNMYYIYCIYIYMSYYLITNHNQSIFNHDPLNIYICTHKYIYIIEIHIYIYMSIIYPSNLIMILYNFGVEHQDF